MSSRTLDGEDKREPVVNIYHLLSIYTALLSFEECLVSFMEFTTFVSRKEADPTYR